MENTNNLVITIDIETNTFIGLLLIECRNVGASRTGTSVFTCTGTAIMSFDTGNSLIRIADSCTPPRGLIFDSSCELFSLSLPDSSDDF